MKISVDRRAMSGREHHYWTLILITTILYRTRRETNTNTKTKNESPAEIELSSKASSSSLLRLLFSMVYRQKHGVHVNLHFQILLSLRTSVSKSPKL